MSNFGAERKQLFNSSFSVLSLTNDVACLIEEKGKPDCTSGCQTPPFPSFPTLESSHLALCCRGHYYGADAATHRRPSSRPRIFTTTLARPPSPASPSRLELPGPSSSPCVIHQETARSFALQIVTNLHPARASSIRRQPGSSRCRS